MYSIVPASSGEILSVYIVIIGGCILLSPVVSLLISTISRGTERWR